MLFGLLTTAGPAFAQLNQRGEQFIADLASAPWNEAKEQAVRVSVRDVAICSRGMRNAIAHRKLLDAAGERSLQRIMRLRISSAGWFQRTLLVAGTYYIGFEEDERGLWTVLTDDTGKRLGVRWFYLLGSSNEHPQLTCTAAEEGAVGIDLEMDQILFQWRFVPEARHDAITAGMRTYRSGSVRLHCDSPWPEQLQHLARQTQRSLKAHERLLNGKTPDGSRFDIYIFSDREDYKKMDRLVTGGSFQDRGGVTSHLTARSYIAYMGKKVLPPGEPQLPRAIQFLAMHEVHHQLAQALYPRSASNWPTWISEGLAEYGTAMASRPDQADPPHYSDLLRGHRLYGKSSRTTPSYRALLRGGSRGRKLEFYAAAYRLIEELHKKPGALAKLLRTFENTSLRQWRRRTYALVAEELPKAEAVYRKFDADYRPGPDDFIVLSGYLDRRGDDFYVTAPGDEQGAVLVTTPQPGPTVEIAGKFSFIGGEQADLYLGYKRRQDRLDFLKVALLRDRVVLFRCHDNEWSALGSQTLSDPLLIGNRDEPRWYEFRATLDPAKEQVRVTIQGRDLVTIACPADLDTTESRVGFGAYDSVVGFSLQTAVPTARPAEKSPKPKPKTGL